MLNNKFPKVTCTMVTNGRCKYIKKSIQCYLQQTYSNKELVIVSQGNKEQNEIINDYINSIKRNDIFFTTVMPDLNLGTMRNLSVDLSQGDIICQWDDDDLYHPDRIITQYKNIRQNSNRVACAYCDFIKYYETTREAYWCDWSGERNLSGKFLPGSIMFHKKVFGMFSSFYPQKGNQCHVEEDLNVINKLLEKGEIGSIWAGWNYIYVYHGDNTYDLNHHNWTLDTSSGKKVFSVDDLLVRKNLIDNTFNLVDIGDSVKVRSKERLAFNYEKCN